MGEDVIELRPLEKQHVAQIQTDDTGYFFLFPSSMYTSNCTQLLKVTYEQSTTGVMELMIL